MQRTPEKAKSQEEHDFLEGLNTCVAPLNDVVSIWTSERVDHPFIFVIGAPRAGTTLLAQTIAYCYKFSYITNIAARFWRAPLVGIDLSHSVLGQDPAFDMGLQFFKSSYGRTKGGGGLHEFSYFWQRWLCPAGSSVPMSVIGDLCCSLGRIQSKLDGPVVMKGAIAAMYHDQISGILGKNATWVNVERDALDNCISILDARRTYFGNDHAWFGYEVPGLRAETESMGARDQIATQVLRLQEFYGSIADGTTTLRGLCFKPKETLSEILPRQLEYMRDPQVQALRFVGHGDRGVDRILFQKALNRCRR